MRSLFTASITAWALGPCAVASAQSPAPLVVVVEAQGQPAQAARVREALARELSRPVVELGDAGSDADGATQISIVVGAERGAVTVHSAGGSHGIRSVAEGAGRDPTWIVPYVVALLVEIEGSDHPGGLASWTGGSARTIRVLSPGLLPWPGDDVVRRETVRRTVVEDGSGLSAPAPSR